MTSPAVRFRKAFFALRPEEAVALLFLAPTTWLTFVAWDASRAFGEIGPRFAGGVLRLGVAIFCAAILGAAARRQPAPGTWLFGLREMLPFLLCILIYTNLHDTIGFVNPNDVHDQLIAIDQWMFGVQPCVWTERFITPFRTEVFEFFYAMFLVVAVIVPLALMRQRRWADFRRASFTLIVCFFLGYALYVIFPAAPPRLTLATEFTKNLSGYPFFISAASAHAFAMLPTTSRAAFPSLHCAISLLALLLALRLTRPLFFVLVPIAIGLWAATVYLRHHYVIDIFAGWLLAPVAYAIAPRIDAWWNRNRAGAMGEGGDRDKEKGGSTIAPA